MTWHLMRRSRGADVPARIVVSNRSQHRLDEIARIHRQIDHAMPIDYVLAPSAQANDEDKRAEADRIAQRVAGLMWAGLRSVHSD